MRTPALALILSLSGQGNYPGALSKHDIDAPPLKRGCVLREGLAFGVEVAVLKCGNEERRIDARSALEGFVSIADEQDALRLVRVFSAEGRWILGVEPVNAELMVTANVVEHGFTLRRSTPPRWFVPPTVTRTHGRRGKTFEVTRTLVVADYKVMAVTEEVTETGQVRVLSRRLLRKDGREFGRFQLRGPLAR